MPRLRLVSALLATTLSVGAASASVAPTQASATGTTSINAGGPALSTSGFTADAYYSGGRAGTTSGTVSGSGDLAAYRTVRYGMSNYSVPMANGTYSVTLKMIESHWTSAGKRIFNVDVEGRQVLSAFDVFAAAKGKNVGVDRTFSAVVNDGRLDVGFTRVADNPSVAALVITPVAVQKASVTGAPAPKSLYDSTVLADRPASFFDGTIDRTGRVKTGRSVGAMATTRMPNGDSAPIFDRGRYLEFPDDPAYSISTTGVLTVEYWMRPDTLQFPAQEGPGYVKVLGKGAPGQWEWYGRMYSQRNGEDRPNRISGYVFNPTGGLGAGSYYQDPVRAGEWMHVALVYNARDRSTRYPTGYTKIYKNGVLRDQDALIDYSIVPRDGSQPLRIGTVDLNSFFLGAIGKVAVYNSELPATRVLAHSQAMR